MTSASAEATPTRPDNRLSPEVRRAGVVVVLGTIMAILDTTIVAVALPTLAKDFHVTVNTIQWVTTGYLLALAVVIPLSGWAMHRFGGKPVYMMSLVLFVVGSVLCGLAWSATALIAFRVLQGFGGGMIMPVGQAIMARTAGPDKMNRVMAVIGIPTLLGPILGPVIGGAIVSNVSWRWIFFVNVPIGIVALHPGGALPGDDAAGPRPPLRPDRLPAAGARPGPARLRALRGGQRRRLLLTGVQCSLAGRRAAVRRLRLAFVPGPGATARHAAVPPAQLLGRHDLHLPDRRHPLRDDVPAAALLPGLPGRVAVDGRPAHGAPGHRRRPGHAPGRQPGRPVRPPSDGSVGHGAPGARDPRLHPGLRARPASPSWLALFVRGIGLGFGMMPVFAASYRGLTHAEVPRASTATNIIRQVGGSIGVAVFAVVLQNQITQRFPGQDTSLGTMAAQALPADAS